MERVIDEIFDFKGRTLQVRHGIKGYPCYGCYFAHPERTDLCSDNRISHYIGICWGDGRIDGKNIIFAEVKN